MADEQLIKPRELPAAATVFANDAIMTDDGVTVGKATPVQVVNAGAPVPTEAEAIAGTDNSKRMTPLTVKQVLDSVTAPSVLRAAAWAESNTPPDPAIPGSKSAKSWASESERLGREQADRAEAAAADAVNNAPFVVKDVAEFFAKTDLVAGARYMSKDGCAWDVLSSGVGDFVVAGKQVSVIPVNGQIDVRAFLPLGNGANVDCTDGILAWCSKMQALQCSGVIVGDYGIRGGQMFNIRYRQIRADASLHTLDVTDVGAYLNADYTRLTGRLHIVCGSGAALSKTVYDAYRQKIGFLIPHAARCTVEALSAWGTKRQGVVIASGSNLGPGNSNLANFTLLQANWCGADYAWMDKTPTTIVNTGSSGSSGQNAVLTFSPGDIPDTLDVYDAVWINSEALIVTGIDRDTGAVTCWPQLRNTTPSPTRFIIGSGVSLEGSDANLVVIDTVDVSGGGTPLYFRAMFGATIGQIHGATQTFTLRIGRWSSDSCHGLLVGGCYRENIGREVLEVTNIINGRHRVGYGTTMPAEVYKVIPVGLENSDSWFTHTETQVVLPEQPLEVGRMTVNVRRSAFGKYHSRTVLPGQSTAGYLLITKYGGGSAGAKRVLGTIEGGRGMSSAGNAGFSLDIEVNTAPSAVPSVLWSSKSSSPVRLVLVTVSGEQWIALEAPAILGSVCFFTGQIEGDNFSEIVWVPTASGSAVTDIPTARTGFARSGGASLIRPAGPYADDAAAASAGVQIGEVYAVTGGTIAWRQA